MEGLAVPSSLDFNISYNSESESQIVEDSSSSVKLFKTALMQQYEVLVLASLASSALSQSTYPSGYNYIDDFGPVVSKYLWSLCNVPDNSVMSILMTVMLYEVQI